MMSNNLCSCSLNARKDMRQQTALGLRTPSHRRDLALQSAKFSDPARTIDTTVSNNGIEISTETVVASDSPTSRFGMSRYAYGLEKPPSLLSAV
jgi:hypothetical protein